MVHLSMIMMMLADKTAAISFLPSQIIFLMPAVLGMLTIIVLVRGFVRRKDRLALPDEPTCGKCGYIVRGLSSSICPECGSDLRIVGVIPPNTPRPPSAFDRCLNWTITLTVIAFSLSNVASDEFAPMTYTHRALRVVSCRIDHVDMRIMAEARGTAVYWKGSKHTPYIPPQELTLTEDGAPGQPAVLHTNLATKDWTLTEANNKTVTGKDFDIEATLALLETKGFGRSDQRVREMAEYVHRSVQELTSASTQPQSWNKSCQNGFFVASQTVILPLPAQPFAATACILIAFWLLVWVLGIWLITRHFRRKEQAAMAVPATAES